MNYVPLTVAWAQAQLPLLSDEEVGVLMRLMVYVCGEQSLLPLDIDGCRRIAAALRRDAQRALDRVLAAHFDITPLGRVPRNLPSMLALPTTVQLKPAVGALEESRYRDAERDVERDSFGVTGVTQKDQARLRQKSIRERKEPLRSQLVSMGVRPRKNAGIRELEQLLDEQQRRHDSVTPSVTPRDLRASSSLREDVREEYKGEGERAGVTLPTRAGAACLAMRTAGLQRANPSHPRLLRLLDAGVTDTELADVVRDFPGKPMEYVLATVEGRRRDAAAKGAVPEQRDALQAWAGSAVAAALRGKT